MYQIQKLEVLLTHHNLYQLWEDKVDSHFSQIHIPTLPSREQLVTRGRSSAELAGSTHTSACFGGRRRTTTPRNRGPAKSTLDTLLSVFRKTPQPGHGLERGHSGDVPPSPFRTPVRAKQPDSASTQPIRSVQLEAKSRTSAGSTPVPAQNLLTPVTKSAQPELGNNPAGFGDGPGAKPEKEERQQQVPPSTPLTAQKRQVHCIFYNVAARISCVSACMYLESNISTHHHNMKQFDP